MLNKHLQQVIAWSSIGVAALLTATLLVVNSEVTGLKISRLTQENEALQAAVAQSTLSTPTNGQPVLGKESVQTDSAYIIVKYNENGGVSPVDIKNDRANVEAVEGLTPVLTFEDKETVVYKVPKSSTADEVAQRLEFTKTESVEYVEVDAVTELVAFTADDEYFKNGSLWGMYGDASEPANPFGSQSAEAWKNGHIGETKVVIGVNDTGVDYTHPDLYLNIFLNQAEIPSTIRSSLVDTVNDGLITFHDLNNPANAAQVSDKNGNRYIDAGDLLNDSRWENGIDDDSNGYMDDLIGWDFNYNDNDPSDVHGHGTHLAGTIGAVGGNASGVAGVGWRTTILPLKYTFDDGSGFTSRAARAMDYMVNLSKDTRNQGYRFAATNNSWGTNSYSVTLQSAVERAAAANIITVAAAGNSQRNTDSQPYYPQSITTSAAVGYEGVVSVGANNNIGERAWFSNYGERSVDLLAPGQEIVSTTRGGGYAGLTGTSMAAPHAAGALGVYVAKYPNATGLEMRTALLNAVQKSNAARDITASGGLLNIADMLPQATTTVVDTTPPTPPRSVRLVTAGFDSLSLEWEPATDNADVASYQVFRDGAKIADAVEPFYLDTNLLPKTKYQYTIRAVDTSGNVSEESSVLSATTLVSPMIVESFAVVDKAVNSAALGINLSRAGTVRVHYSTNRNNLNMVARSTSSALSHTLHFTGIKPGALYYYRIVAIDAQDSTNVARTRPSSFIAAATDAFSIISYGVSTTTATSAQMSVTLSEAGNVRIQYGTSTRLLNQVSYVPARAAVDGMIHTVPLTSLTPNTTYFYRVVGISLSSESKVKSTGVSSFSTLAP